MWFPKLMPYDSGRGVRIIFIALWVVFNISVSSCPGWLARFECHYYFCFIVVFSNNNITTTKDIIQVVLLSLNQAYEKQALIMIFQSKHGAEGTLSHFLCFILFVLWQLLTLRLYFHCSKCVCFLHKCDPVISILEQLTVYSILFWNYFFHVVILMTPLIWKFLFNLFDLIVLITFSVKINIQT